MKKKICFVATIDIDITSFLINHLKKLVEIYDLTVITNTNNLKFLSEHNIKANVIKLSFSRKINLPNDFYCLVKLIHIFIENQFLIVHSITPKAGLLAMFAAKLSFVPIRIHSFTGQVWASKIGLKRQFLKFIDRILAKLTTHNLIDSKSQRNFLVQQKILDEKKSIVFGSGSVSGVDFNRFKFNKQTFTKVRKEMSIPYDAFVFMYLGRLNIDKGILDLAKAFSKIHDKKVFWLLVGSDEGHFLEKIKEINSHKFEQIRFINFSTSPENYLSASNVLCLPSYREGFGNVIIEAAAIGIPAIASDIYGIRDAIINMQTGILHRPKDVNAILESMQFFINKPELVKKFGEAAKKRAKAEFDKNMLSKYWLDFYTQVLASQAYES